jgi:hypothetical protein
VKRKRLREKIVVFTYSKTFLDLKKTKHCCKGKETIKIKYKRPSEVCRSI